MKRWRRSLIVIALLLLAGAVLNVGMAWLGAVGYLGRLERVNPRGEALPHWHLPLDSYGETITSHITVDVLRSNATTLCSESTRYEWCRTLVAGWPLRSMRLGAFHGMHLQPTYRSVVWVRAGTAHKAHLFQEDVREQPLPLRPLPTGFAINTLFYAVVVGTILALPLSASPIRRRLRARRGRCPKCGYDLAGLADPAAPCPECGAAP